MYKYIFSFLGSNFAKTWDDIKQSLEHYSWFITYMDIICDNNSTKGKWGKWAILEQNFDNLVELSWYWSEAYCDKLHIVVELRLITQLLSGTEMNNSKCNKETTAKCIKSTLEKTHGKKTVKEKAQWKQKKTRWQETLWESQLYQ